MLKEFSHEGRREMTNSFNQIRINSCYLTIQDLISNAKEPNGDFKV